MNMKGWIYTKQRVISKDGVVLFEGLIADAENFCDDNNLSPRDGVRTESFCKAITKWNEKEGRYTPII